MIASSGKISSALHGNYSIKNGNATFYAMAGSFAASVCLRFILSASGFANCRDACLSSSMSKY